MNESPNSEELSGNSGQLEVLQTDLAALRSERDELTKWKSLQQQALASMAMTLLEAGYKGDGVVDGVKWLVAERDELARKVRNLEDALPVLRDALCAATHGANEFNCGTQIIGKCSGCAGDRIREAAAKLIEELQKQDPSDGE